MALLDSLECRQDENYDLYTLIGDGELFMVVKNFTDEKARSRVRIMTDMFICGLSQIAGFYPGNLKLRCLGTNNKN